MALEILSAVGTAILPSAYYTHLSLAVVGIVTVHTFRQGSKTHREEVLHGRTILVTVVSHFNIAISLSG
jgi:hypothetical protein